MSPGHAEQEPGQGERHSIAVLPHKRVNGRGKHILLKDIDDKFQSTSFQEVFLEELSGQLIYCFGLSWHQLSTQDLGTGYTESDTHSLLSKLMLSFLPLSASSLPYPLSLSSPHAPSTSLFQIHQLHSNL